jgi:hypothetical protein
MLKTATLAALTFSLLSYSPRARAEATNEEKGEKVMVMMEKMADIVAKKEDSCDKRGDNLSKFMDDNAAALKQSKEDSAKLTPEQKKAFMEKYAARFKAAQEKMMAGFTECKDSKKFKEAIQKK